MEITVKLFATLRKGRFDIEVREIPPGRTIKQLIDDLDFSQDQIAIIIVNNKHAKRDQTLSAGDVVAFFPALGGG